MQNRTLMRVPSHKGVMSGLVGADNRFGRDFNNPDAALQGDIVALYDIGCIIGSILVFCIGEKFGRRWMLMGGGTIMILGTIILASSTTVAQLIVGRIVTGVVCQARKRSFCYSIDIFQGQWNEQQHCPCLSERDCSLENSWNSSDSARNNDNSWTLHWYSIW